MMATGDIRGTRGEAESAVSRGQLLTVRELAEHLRVHRSTIYRLLRQHRIPGFRINGDWRFDRDEIERWIRRKTKIE
jgi:excisionase family DNA binding protein